MTVKELIQKLSLYEDDKEVYLRDETFNEYNGPVIIGKATLVALNHGTGAVLVIAS